MWTSKIMLIKYKHLTLVTALYLLGNGKNNQDRVTLSKGSYTCKQISVMYYDKCYITIISKV